VDRCEAAGYGADGPATAALSLVAAMIGARAALRCHVGDIDRPPFSPSGSTFDAGGPRRGFHPTNAPIGAWRLRRLVAG
jgi:hypothetical protein